MKCKFLLPLALFSGGGALACPAIPAGQFLSHATSRPAGLEVDCSIENTLYQRMYQKEDARAHLRYFEQFRVTGDPAQVFRQLGDLLQGRGYHTGLIRFHSISEKHRDAVPSP